MDITFFIAGILLIGFGLYLRMPGSSFGLFTKAFGSMVLLVIALTVFASFTSAIILSGITFSAVGHTAILTFCGIAIGTALASGYTRQLLHIR
jgi:hypothetical protein